MSTLFSIYEKSFFIRNKKVMIKIETYLFLYNSKILFSSLNAMFTLSKTTLP